MFECYEQFHEFICERIEKLRIQKGATARDMSLSIGQNPGYINNIENKNNVPSMKGLFYICEYFKITPKDFFDYETETPALLSELITECKNLNEKSMKSLLDFIRVKK